MSLYETFLSLFFNAEGWSFGVEERLLTFHLAPALELALA